VSFHTLLILASVNNGHRFHTHHVTRPINTNVCSFQIKEFKQCLFLYFIYITYSNLFLRCMKPQITWHNNNILAANDFSCDISCINYECCTKSPFCFLPINAEINDAVTHKQAYVGHLQINTKKSIIRCCFAWQWRLVL